MSKTIKDATPKVIVYRWEGKRAVAPRPSACKARKEKGEARVAGRGAMPWEEWWAAGG